MTPNHTHMAETTEAPLWNENEPAKVESWRLHVCSRPATRSISPSGSPGARSTCTARSSS